MSNSKMTKEQKHDNDLAAWKEYRENYQWPTQHWRAWGSWFSWGSPVGLGIFFLELAATIWIIAQVF